MYIGALIAGKLPALLLLMSVGWLLLLLLLLQGAGALPL
jgi:hypothetical protein